MPQQPNRKDLYAIKFLKRAFSGSFSFLPINCFKPCGIRSKWLDYFIFFLLKRAVKLKTSGCFFFVELKIPVQGCDTTMLRNVMMPGTLMPLKDF
jgi:hypothetical protein